MSIYEKNVVLGSERYVLRRSVPEDLDGLLRVYSDRLALPFFNSDNCNGDNFYYPTRERMGEALRFWAEAYEKRWFVRLTILEKESGNVIGTVEMCSRESEDAFDGMCILRVDVGSACETEEVLTGIFRLAASQTDALLGTRGIVTKAPIYAVERIKALKSLGFTPSEHFLIGGHDGYPYQGYWTYGGGKSSGGPAGA